MELLPSYNANYEKLRIWFEYLGMASGKLAFWRNIVQIVNTNA